MNQNRISFTGQGCALNTLKRIWAGIGVTACLLYLGCGSVPVAEAGIPVISQIIPQAITAGASNTTLQVVGANITDQTVVLWNGAQLPTTVIDNTTVASPVLSASLAVPGTAELQLLNSITGKTSASVEFKISSAPALLVTTRSLPNAVVGTPYSATLTAAGGVPGYTWKLTSGKMPSGLSLSSSTGVISGTPTAAGTFSLGLTVSDKSHPGQSELAVLTLAVTATPLNIITASLPGATDGTSYSQTLQASGGTPSYSWSITSGSLPAGLTLTSSGVISGIATASGTFSFHITAADKGSPQQTQTTTLSITATANPLKITTAALASGTTGSAYSQSLIASGGIPAYSWSLSSGSLPAGLALSSTGAISGTPTASGTFSFAATVSDKSTPAQTLTAPLTITVAAVPLRITTSALIGGTIGTAYSQTLGASGGTVGYSWSISSGSLPAGLTLTSTGAISGTPSTTGTSSFAATVSDSGNPIQTQSATLSIVVAATPIKIMASALAPADYGRSYSQSLQATGGTPTYKWSIASGQLPSGLSLSSTGAISGTPTSGTSTFTASVSDSGNPVESVSAPMTITVAPGALTITGSTLPAVTVGSAYSQALQASGGATPYTWSITSGQLPLGLSLSPSTGAISGTPTASGTASFTATVMDSSSPAQAASVALTIVVAANQVNPPSPLTITGSALAAGTDGAAYSQTLRATGGTAPYSWSIPAGQLPAGLTLSASIGVISGTPSASDAAGTYSFTVAVTDSKNPAQTVSASTSIPLSASATPLAIASSALAAGTNGTVYSQVLKATGGTPAYTWSISSGSLPAGLTLAATTGTVSGTPTASGTSSFTATVSDSGSPAQTQSASTSITVTAAQQTSGIGNTWYIRPDGGTRYSANQTSGQCDGLADAPYPGSGTNQHCAFSDYRYLWDDQSYSNDAWVIAGGDTVIIRGGPWRVGFDSNTGAGAGYTWCFGGQGPYACSNPTIPAGSPTQHTRILGENYANCSVGNAADKTKLTQIFGGYGVWTTLNLAGAQYVDVQCLEVTSHAQCITHGSPAVPRNCNTGSGPTLDDYDSEGVSTSTGTHDLLMQDLFIHGNTDRGIKGAIGGIVTCLRCDIYANGMAGWDFDDGTGSNNGNGTASLPGAVWNFKYSIIEWNGCNQIYPNTGVDTCYSQSTGGYGDGVGTPPGMCLNANIDHSAFNYNTQDGMDLGHIDTGNCSATITNSSAVGNNGGTFKTGPNENPYVFENNLAEANCLRLSMPIAGTSTYFNAHLSDYCRADDAMSFNFRQGGTAILANNTLVGYAPTSYDVGCWDTSCSTSSLTFYNNITIGYDNPTTYNMGGQVGGPGGLYFQEPIGVVTRANNIWFGMRPGSFACPTGYAAEACENPLLVTEPTGQGANFVETELDNFNFALSPGSPAIGAGLPIPSVPLDYTGAQRANPPSIGAYEQ